LSAGGVAGAWVLTTSRATICDGGIALAGAGAPAPARLWLTGATAGEADIWAVLNAAGFTPVLACATDWPFTKVAAGTAVTAFGTFWFTYTVLLIVVLLFTMVVLFTFTVRLILVT
jgi:hypothetical protein